MVDKPFVDFNKTNLSVNHKFKYIPANLVSPLCTQKLLISYLPTRLFTLENTPPHQVFVYQYLPTKNCPTNQPPLQLKKIPNTVTSENIPELPSPTKTPVGADRRSPVLSSPVRTKSDSLDPNGMGSVREKWLRKCFVEILNT